MSWVRVLALADLPAGEMIGAKLGKRKAAIYRLEDGEVYATANVCTHEYALLTDGWLEGCEVECPIHAGRFDVRNGRGLCAPIERNLEVYQVEIRDGDVYLLVPDEL